MRVWYKTELGCQLVAEDARSNLCNSVLPFVCEHLPNVHFRVQKCMHWYSLQQRWYVGFS